MLNEPKYLTEIEVQASYTIKSTQESVDEAKLNAIISASMDGIEAGLGEGEKLGKAKFTGTCQLISTLTRADEPTETPQ